MPEPNPSITFVKVGGVTKIGGVTRICSQLKLDPPQTQESSLQMPPLSPSNCSKSVDKATTIAVKPLKIGRLGQSDSLTIELSSNSKFPDGKGEIH